MPQIMKQTLTLSKQVLYNEDALKDRLPDNNIS